MTALNHRYWVILDRDGTINVERHYLSDPDDVELLPGAAAGMRKLRDLDCGLVVVTNQSGVARGYFDHARLAEIHQRLEEILRSQGVRLAGIYSCTDHPDAPTPRRKPSPGMLLEAAQRFRFEPAQSFVVGDKACDVDLGHAVGATTFLVSTGHGGKTIAAGKCRPHYTVNSLVEVADQIETLIRARTHNIRTKAG